MKKFFRISNNGRIDTCFENCNNNEPLLNKCIICLELFCDDCMFDIYTCNWCNTYTICDLCFCVIRKDVISHGCNS